jgi:hypothetical protein
VVDDRDNLNKLVDTFLDVPKGIYNKPHLYPIEKLAARPAG